MIKEWAKRFSIYMNLAAEAGSYATASAKDRAAALSTITWQTKCQIYNRQTRCKHLKGGRIRNHSTDHAVTTHTFIDGRTRIKCVLCGLDAWSDSGMDFKFAYMQSLAENSTNWPSSSERVQLEVRQGKAVLATFPNTDSGRAALYKEFPNWDGTYAQPEYNPPKQDSSVAIPEGHSPIKGVEASTPEPGPESSNAIIVGENFIQTKIGSEIK